MADAESTGVVIRFHDGKGYGFIKPDTDGEDLFVHQSEIQADGFRTLHEGQKVKFTVVDKNNRQQAVNVTVLAGSDADRSRNRFPRGGRGSFNGNGAGRECYNCGGVGHLARDCSSAVVGGGGGGGGGGCYNCGGFGHMARDCNRTRGGGGGGGGGGCYNCGEVGHLARECTVVVAGGGGGGVRRTSGGGNCFNCGEAGHFARECPANS